MTAILIQSEPLVAAARPRVASKISLGLPVVMLGAAALGALVTLQGAPRAASPYASLSCDALWKARTQILADKGACFKSEREITTFGTVCRAPFGKLNALERRNVNDIRAAEAGKHCPVL